MSKVYKIVQVHLRNEEADIALTAMLRDAEWEFVCCVPIRDDILAYTFRRDLRGYQCKSDSHPEPGIRPASQSPAETKVPTTKADTSNAKSSAAKLKLATQPATYRGQAVLCKDGNPLQIACDEHIVRKSNSVQVISNKGRAYSLITGKLVSHYSKR